MNKQIDQISASRTSRVGMVDFRANNYADFDQQNFIT